MLKNSYFLVLKLKKLITDCFYRLKISLHRFL
jgi:hypothetical protein